MLLSVATCAYKFYHAFCRLSVTYYLNNYDWGSRTRVISLFTNVFFVLFVWFCCTHVVITRNMDKSGCWRFINIKKEKNYIKYGSWYELYISRRKKKHNACIIRIKLLNNFSQFSCIYLIISVNAKNRLNSQTST